MIRRILRVARREYLAYVRTKTFLLGVLMLPLILVLAFGLPALMESMPKPPKRVHGDRRDRALRRRVARRACARKRAGRAASSASRCATTSTSRPRSSSCRAEPGGADAALQAQAVGGKLFACFVISRRQRRPRDARSTSTPWTSRRSGWRRLVRRLLNRMLLIEDLRPRVGDVAFLERALRGVPAEHPRGHRGGRGGRHRRPRGARLRADGLRLPAVDRGPDDVEPSHDQHRRGEVEPHHRDPALVRLALRVPDRASWSGSPAAGLTHARRLGAGRRADLVRDPGRRRGPADPGRHGRRLHRPQRSSGSCSSSCSASSSTPRSTSGSDRCATRCARRRTCCSRS